METAAALGGLLTANGLLAGIFLRLGRIGERTESHAETLGEHDNRIEALEGADEVA